MVTPVSYTDQVDGSLVEMARMPERVLDAALRRQTSDFEWAEHEQSDETARGLAQLEADLAAGEEPQGRHADQRAEIGDAHLIAWPSGS